MTNDFMPRKDADLLIWLQSFSSGISSSPATYELTASDAATIATAVQEYADALALAEAPLTRTPGNIAAKDTKRDLAKAICREYAIQIKYNNAISNQSKLDIGVRPVNTSREPIYCPVTSPLINVKGATPGAHTLTFADSMDPNKRAKPFGAAGLQLFAYIGDEPTLNEDDASFIGMYTKNPIAVAFDPTDDGKCATYFARWVGKRGDVSNWSLPVGMRIAA